MPKKTAEGVSGETEKTLEERLQAPMQYQWKVQTVNESKTAAQCVAYIDARDVMERLDAVVGSGGWSDEYMEVRGQLFCRLTVGGVSKMDVGTPGTYEKEKAEASDAFKRAAVKWGIGRFLYNLPIRKIACVDGKPVDPNGRRVWDVTAYFRQLDGVAESVRAHQELPAIDFDSGEQMPAKAPTRPQAAYAAPAGPARQASPGNPASVKQKGFAKALMKELGHDSRWAAAQGVDLETMSAAQASGLIEALLQAKSQKDASGLGVQAGPVDDTPSIPMDSIEPTNDDLNAAFGN